MRSYFRLSRLTSAHLQAVDVAGLQKLQLQVRAYMRSYRSNTGTNDDPSRRLSISAWSSASW